ncbi:flagellar hook-associated protein FlgK [Novosphingobium panipatense]|uniref:Flagellar hook-associated protein 1 n=2 Tax=Novosphingobium panipatense TaxID=428991 RepID=A0ABY1QP97_9SPHN|nr:flagellar basal body rod C-terminal domain-containing protein [Novosphingobium panipatense]SMP76169.1 flagellar hook-associated protein 1 FlgK [Novosphingobium panipatense]
MSLSSILNSAKSGLAASQAGMQTVSTNIANVGTAGYARQTVSQSASIAGGNVTGVVVGEPARVADKFLENTVYQRGGEAGRTEAVSTYLDRLQSLLGTPGADSGLSARLTAISTSISEVGGLQGSPEAIAMFTGNVADAIYALDALQSDVGALRSDVESEVSDTVDRVNVLLRKVHGLNAEVSRLQGLGLSASGPADERMNALQELSGLVEVKVREQPDGRVTIDTASGQVLLDKRLRQLNYASGAGASAGMYKGISIHFAADNGALGASAGETIETSGVGGKLGGLIDMRDRVLPGFTDQLGQLFGGLAGTLNKVANEGTASPPPQTLTGQPNGLVAADRLGFTGKVTFAVVGQDGILVAKTTLDFDSPPPLSTVADAVAAINDGLAPAGSASFENGVLSISAASGKNGIAIGQDPDSPSDRAGIGFSQFFGLNNLIRSDRNALAPSGFASDDPHGFSADDAAQIVLRDPSGKLLASHELDVSAGGTWGDLVDGLNGSDLGSFGRFALDGTGRITFTASTANAGAAITIPSDATDRFDTGLSFSALSGLGGASAALATAHVSSEMATDTSRLPLARLQLDATPGQQAIGAADIRGANAFVDALASTIDFGKDGRSTIDMFASRLLGGAGAQASLAKTSALDASARLGDAVNRRDSFSGVNIDEELAQMVVLQNSYSASARVISTASQMYDTLLNMV